jgi:hypothetical protein
MEDSTKSTTDREQPPRRSRRGFLAGAAALAATGLIGGNALAQQQQETTFQVRVENVSTDTTLETTLPEDDEGSAQPIPLSPGAYAVHQQGAPIFTNDEPERDNGLEEVAEDGDPTRLAESLSTEDIVADSDAFTTPVGADEPAPLGPGEAYEFTATATPSARYLSLVTMFVPSNDLFYSLGGPNGIELFDGDDPVSGSVTDQVGLWDAGTEINEEPGVGENQVQRQRGPGVGLIERDTVVPIEEVNGYTYPDVADVIEVTIEPVEPGETPPETAVPPETETETPPEETPPEETPPEETPPEETPPEDTPPEETPTETPPEETETPPEETETPPEETPTETPPEETPIETPTETPPEETPIGTATDVPIETPTETPDTETPVTDTLTTLTDTPLE